MARTDHRILRASFLALLIATLTLTGCGSSAEPKSASTPPPKPAVSVSARSSVVSTSAGPEEVVRAYVLAMSEDRPGDANALWAGPLKVTGGFDAWEGHRDLVIDEVAIVPELPMPAEVTSSTRQATEEFRDKYQKFAIVDCSMYLVRGDGDMFEPGELRMEFELGRTSDGRWDVLGFGSVE